MIALANRSAIVDSERGAVRSKPRSRVQRTTSGALSPMCPVVARTAIGWSLAWQRPVQVRLRQSLKCDQTRPAPFLCRAKRAEPQRFRVDAVGLSLQPGFDDCVSLGLLFGPASEGFGVLLGVS